MARMLEQYFAKIGVKGSNAFARPRFCKTNQALIRQALPGHDILSSATQNPVQADQIGDNLRATCGQRVLASKQRKRAIALGGNLQSIAATPAPE